MAIDPTIALGVQQPVINTPLQNLTGAVQLRDLMTQQQLRRQQIQQSQVQTADLQAQTDERQRDLADQATVQKMQADPAFHSAFATGDVSNLLGGKVQPKTLVALNTSAQGLREKAALLDEKERSKRSEAAGKLTNIIAGLDPKDDQTAAEQFSAGVHNLSAIYPEYAKDYSQALNGTDVNAGNIRSVVHNISSITGLNKSVLDAVTAQEKQKQEVETSKATAVKDAASSLNTGLETAAKTVGAINDDAGWQTWRAGLDPAVQSKVPVNFTPENKQAVIRMGVSPDTLAKVTLPTGEMGVYMNARAQKLGKNIDQLTPDERLDILSGYKKDTADPDVRAAMLAQRNLATVLEQTRINQMPTPEQIKDAADDLVAHRIAPSQVRTMAGSMGALGAAFTREVYHQAKLVQPEFNSEQSEAEYNLTKSPQFQNTVRNMDSITDSLAQLQHNADALGNGSIRSINELVNHGKDQFNNVNLKKFQTDKTLLSEEIGRLLAGGGTGSGTSDKKLEMAGSLLKDSDDPKAIASSISEVKQLLGNRRGTLTHGTYLENSTTSKPQFNIPAGADVQQNPAGKRRYSTDGRKTWVVEP